MSKEHIPRATLRRENFRFFLRPCSESDSKAIYEAALESRDRVSAWMDWLYDEYALDDAIDWATRQPIAWLEGSAYEFVIIDSEDHKIAGCCGLNNLNKKDLIGNLGYWVRESKTRLGAATEATILLADFGLNVLKYRRIEVVAAKGNLPSQKVARKAGAELEGIQQFRLKVGHFSHDAYVFVFLGNNAH